MVRVRPLQLMMVVFTHFGAVGHLHCLDAESGEIIWMKDSEAELNAQRPQWGFAASPVIWKHLVIAHIGARPSGCFVAFDRISGKEIWRSSDDPAGYCTPILIDHAGYEQFIGWTPAHVMGISPENGEVHWSVPYTVTNGVSIATPVFQEGIVLVSGYWEGTKAIRLGKNPRDATLLWIEDRYLRALMSQPLYRDGYGHLLDKFHGLICFKFQTGEKVWSDNHQMTPKGRNPQASMVWVGETDSVLILNAAGELIHARFTPDAFHEISRAEIIVPTWAPPAYYDTYIYARNDRELVCHQLSTSIENSR